MGGALVTGLAGGGLQSVFSGKVHDGGAGLGCGNGAVSVAFGARLERAGVAGIQQGLAAGFDDTADNH